MRRKKLFEFVAEIEQGRAEKLAESIAGLQLALEHQKYKQIPKT